MAPRGRAFSLAEAERWQECFTTIEVGLAKVLSPNLTTAVFRDKETMVVCASDCIRAARATTQSIRDQASPGVPISTPTPPTGTRSALEDCRGPVECSNPQRPRQNLRLPKNGFLRLGWRDVATFHVEHSLGATEEV